MATLEEILAAREARAERQRQLLARFGKPLICFTMNIPGPRKQSSLIAAGFRLGVEELLAQLGDLPLLYRREYLEDTGCEGYFAVDAPARLLKERTVKIEEATALGRLFDLDVLDTDGQKLQRQGERKCLLCGRSARVCGPRRVHTAEELAAAADRILAEAVGEARCRRLGVLALQALLFEAVTSPKPGLVDRDNSGSHRDMDLFTFMASAAALGPYFEGCARAGLAGAGLEQLRILGRRAEADMLRATGGVNTHKGAIFALGLLCAASGARWETEEILARCAQLCQGITARDLGKVTAQTARTAGERLYAQYGITGIRGQAEAGFPAVKNTGLPVLRMGLEAGLSLERAGCGALLALLTATADTNLISRGGREKAAAVTREVAVLLAKNPFPEPETLRALDEAFRAENLSPGGSADLLAVTYFLHFLENEA